MYVSYDFYKQTFGGTIPEDDFSKVEAKAQAAGVKSETNDGYSVTYITEGQDGQTAEELLRKKILEAARVYLLPTGWLSRSLKGGCRHVCTDCDNSL